jgi:uncharacterized protein (DUF1697 family)
MPRLETYVALLRGINVGGKHKLPMKELAELVNGCGCSEVRTYIQSGNVVFAASRKCADELPALLAQRIEKRFGFQVPVIVRGREELARVLRDNPFVKAGLPEQTLHVYFLADLPSTAAVKSLDANRSAPEAFRTIGREIYLHLPNGMGRTKLTNAYFDSKLSTFSTARNWATVNKLLEMMEQHSEP